MFGMARDGIRASYRRDRLKPVSHLSAGHGGGVAAALEDYNAKYKKCVEKLHFLPRSARFLNRIPLRCSKFRLAFSPGC